MYNLGLGLEEIALESNASGNSVASSRIEIELSSRRQGERVGSGGWKMFGRERRKYEKVLDESQHSSGDCDDDDDSQGVPEELCFS